MYGREYGVSGHHAGRHTERALSLLALASTALTNSTAVGSSTLRRLALPLPARRVSDDSTARDLAYAAQTQLGRSADR
eukprot:1762468-Pleurochrysis_carterae.AAC.1